MKLIDQVISLEQAKRLSQLGITQGLSAFFWDDYEGKQELRPNQSPEGGYSPGSCNTCFSAFTVAELGAMIGKGTNAASLLYDAVQDQMNRSHSFTIVLGVQFVVNCVIGMLETGRLTPKEVNARLCAQQ